MGLEVHVKDEAQFPGKWAFFGFDNEKTAKMIPTSADCYSCHSAHAAVDTTFVQFYPTLLPIAKSKGTFKVADEKETETPDSLHDWKIKLIYPLNRQQEIYLAVMPFHLKLNLPQSLRLAVQP